MIQFYKLVSGESIVARQVKKTKTEVEIDLPIQILEVHGETDEGENAYILSPWLPFAGSLTVRLNKTTIILSTPVSEEMEVEYEDRVDRYLSGDCDDVEAEIEVEPETNSCRRKCSTGTSDFQQQKKRRSRWPLRRF